MSKTPASILDHPVHPMLISIPLGLWVFSFVCDAIFFLGHRGNAWEVVALYSMIGGIVGALAAAVPGFIDWLSLTPNSRTKAIGTYHMIINLVAVVLYGVNAWWRVKEQGPSIATFFFSLFLILLLGISGWLGGALVYEHGVGVNTKD